MGPQTRRYLKQRRSDSVLKISKRLLIASAVVGALCAGHAAQAQDKIVYALTTTNISVGNAPQSSVPRAMNYWKSEGLDVDVIGVAGTMLGVQQVATGAVQFATAGPESVLIARQKGLPVIAVYV